MSSHLWRLHHTKDMQKLLFKVCHFNIFTQCPQNLIHSFRKAQPRGRFVPGVLLLGKDRAPYSIFRSWDKAVVASH